MLEHPEEYQRMAAVEDRHWWYRSLHLLTLRAVQRHHPRGLEAILLDAGCGTGGLLRFLRGRGMPRVSGFDRSPEAVGLGRARGLPVTPGDLRELARSCAAGSVDVVTSADTLYFLEPAEQRAFVQQAWTVLSPGGLLVLNLPAFPAFRGSHDLRVGIRWRVTPADLPRLLADGLFDILERRCWPGLLAPAVLAVRAAQRRRLAREPGSAARSDVALPPVFLNGLFYWLTRLEIALPPCLPRASSLFLVGRRRG